MNSNPPTQRRLIITVDGPDIDALESSTHAHLQARALREIAGLILNFGQTLLSIKQKIKPQVPTTMLLNALRESQCCSSSHEQSDSDESPEDLEESTEWNFQGYLFFSSDGWCTDEIYEAKVLALVEQQYLPKVPVPVQRMTIFYHSA